MESNVNSKRRLEADDKENDDHARTKAAVDGEKRKPTSPAAIGNMPSSETIFGISSSSPPKFVSLEEIVKAVNGVKNMALAHEIAVDRNFQLEENSDPKSELKSRVETMMHKAFFDLLRERMAEDPPNYEQALSVLKEIKEGLLSCLMPHNTKTKQEIENKLDFELLVQQAKNSTLELLPYLQYCVAMMAKLCCPARDEKIREMTKMTDVPELMRNILETLRSMRIDMANFTLNAVRPHIQAQSVEYERKKFEEFLAICPDGLKDTTIWLRKHCDQVKSSGSPPDLTNIAVKKGIIAFVVTSAYLDLLQWDPEKAYPETATLDATRFTKLGEKLDSVSLLGTILLIAMSNAGPIPQGLPGFREKLKSKVTILLEDKPTDQQELKERLAGVGEVVVRDVEKAIAAHSPLVPRDPAEMHTMNPELKATIIAQITDAANPENPIRKVVAQRCRAFLEIVINSSTASPTRIPPGLTAVHQELTEIAATFLQLTVHNRRVFMSYYVDIIEAEFGLTAKEPVAESTSVKPTSACA